ncbi:hypothetical protein MKK75_20075 [Methylobacterium sp. J-030]|uniref:hypothetical protein n=1 Tax=Methylobacterium sp. J-030 TaxID=2836627 RepID=UPI001FBA3C53|nr:hypothetical protein [Methylobacterium sp. J-030]MCJ2071060.1 hypothetical protein [Methylobacterium sp. J-030]
MSDEIKLVRYNESFQAAWDGFVASSKNGTFLFERAYMDYHKDRFTDCSLLAFRYGTKKPIAILPANCQQTSDGLSLVSHAGLTYGGWVSANDMTLSTMLEIFENMIGWLSSNKFGSLIYKVVPRTFHRNFADEDLYCLFRCGAELFRVDASSVVDMQTKPRWSKGRLHNLQKARSAGIKVFESTDFGEFYQMLSTALVKHDANPVHTAEELAQLHANFPDRIRLFVARQQNDSEAISGILIYDFGQCVHTQYMASNHRGRANGGLDLILYHLISVVFADRRFLSFGISTEDAGRRLNIGLLRQKEMFGARTVAHQFYRISVP